MRFSIAEIIDISDNNLKSDKWFLRSTTKNTLVQADEPYLRVIKTH